SLALDVLARGHQFLRRLKAEHPGQGWISGNKVAVRRVLENALHRVLKDAAIFPFRFFERSFRSLPSPAPEFRKNTPRVRIAKQTNTPSGNIRNTSREAWSDWVWRSRNRASPRLAIAPINPRTCSRRAAPAPVTIIFWAARRPSSLRI